MQLMMGLRKQGQFQFPRLACIVAEVVYWMTSHCSWESSPLMVGLQQSLSCQDWQALQYRERRAVTLSVESLAASINMGGLSQRALRIAHPLGVTQQPVDPDGQVIHQQALYP